MAYEEVLLLNENRRRRRRARVRYIRPKIRRRYYRNDPAPRRHRRFFGGRGVMGTGITIGDFVGAGVGGLASAVIPKLIRPLRYGWLNVLGTFGVAIGGGALIRAIKIADGRFANSFVIGGLTITAIKLLNQLGVLGRTGIAGIGEEEEFEWEDVGAIAPDVKVEGIGEEEEEIVL